MPLAAFGYPFGRMLAADKGYPAVSVNTGTITALRRKEGKLSTIQLDASVNPGNSGGPVVDKKGNLIGIVVSGILGGQGQLRHPRQPRAGVPRRPRTGAPRSTASLFLNAANRANLKSTPTQSIATPR